MAETPNKKAPPCDVVLVGSGERARAWLGPLRRSGRLRAVATVARTDPERPPELPFYRSISEALHQHPTAAFAVALPPRAALEAALQIAEAGRPGVVQAPLHDALVDARLESAANGVRVAHGWVTLPGLRAIRAIMRRSATGRLRVVVAGLPEDERGDLAEALVHALAVVRALLPEAVPSAARHSDGGVLEVALATPSSSSGWKVDVRVHPHGRRLEVRVEAGPEVGVWSWQDDCETVMLGNRPLVARRATPAASVRALAQLLPGSPRGDGLVEAAVVLRSTRSCLALLPTRLPLGDRALRQSASIARRRPADLLGRLGLRGELPVDGGPLPGVLRLALPPEPFELWPFRAGIKPVAFLTVRPEDVDKTLACFGDVCHERRERLVQVDAQDCWTDRRDAGEPRVELYIARDGELARRAAHLQAEVDPTTAIRELGALVGYPPCCVEAFAAQDDRSNNSRNRYHSQARTLRPDGSTQLPWPWELNNLHTMIVPFYPCSYRCESALAWARSCLEEMSLVHAAFASELRATLAQPVIYFDHDHQLAFDGDYVGGRIAFRAVKQLESASPQLTALGAVIGLGNQLFLDDRELVVERDGQTLLRLGRTDPALGFVAPFGGA